MKSKPVTISWTVKALAIMAFCFSFAVLTPSAPILGATAKAQETSAQRLFSFIPAGATATQGGDDSAEIVALLQNPTKLQAQASRFTAAVNRIRPLANKSTFTASDLALADSFIKNRDQGVAIVRYARSKAFAAARSVTAFEQGVRKAAQGKNAQEYIKELENNPNRVNEIPGAREAATAFQRATLGDAAVFDQIAKRMLAKGTRPKSLSSIPSTADQPTSLALRKVAFSNPVGSSKYSFARTEPNPPATTMMVQTGLELALIALAAAYLGVQVTRLQTGAIGRCVDRAFDHHQQCIREERADGGGLTFGERVFCRGLYFADVYLCIILPI